MLTSMRASLVAVATSLLATNLACTGDLEEEDAGESARRAVTFPGDGGRQQVFAVAARSSGCPRACCSGCRTSSRGGTRTPGSRVARLGTGRCTSPTRRRWCRCRTTTTAPRTRAATTPPAACRGPRTCDTQSPALNRSSGRRADRHRPATLRSDPAQNIRGGAALLAHHQRELGALCDDPADWYGAVAALQRRHRHRTRPRRSPTRCTPSSPGRGPRHRRRPARCALASQPASAATPVQLDRLGLRADSRTRRECPRGLGCEWIPAPYEEFGDGDYGNHDLGRPAAAQKIDYIVIHDTEATYDTTLDLVQDPTYVSWQYTLRSVGRARRPARQGQGRRAGTPATGTSTPSRSASSTRASPPQGTWYTEAMYRSSAKLVRYLARQVRHPAGPRSTSSATTTCPARRRRTSPACTGTRARTGTGSTTSTCSARRSAASAARRPAW